MESLKRMLYCGGRAKGGANGKSVKVYLTPNGKSAPNSRFDAIRDQAMELDHGLYHLEGTDIFVKVGGLGE